MSSKVEIFLSGRLIQDTELLVFGDTETRDKACHVLNSSGFDFIKAQQNVIVIDDPMELFWKLKKFLNKSLEIILAPMKVTRTLRANRFYWGVLVHGIIEEHFKYTGERVDKQRVHMDNVINIWGWKPEVETIFGREVIRLDKIPSTSKMDRETFGQFIETIFEYYSHPVDGRHVVYELWQYIDEGDGTYNQYVKHYGKGRH